MGAGIALATAGPPGDVVVVAFAAVVGVGIDVDHLLVARYNTGDWRTLRRCLRSPRLVLIDQSDLFEPGEVSPLQRLLSHVVVGGVLVGGLVPFSPSLALVAAVVVYVHVLMDLAWENYRQDGPSWEATEAGHPANGDSQGPDHTAGTPRGSDTGETNRQGPD